MLCGNTWYGHGGINAFGNVSILSDEKLYKNNVAVHMMSNHYIDNR